MIKFFHLQVSFQFINRKDDFLLKKNIEDFLLLFVLYSFLFSAFAIIKGNKVIINTKLNAEENIRDYREGNYYVIPNIAETKYEDYNNTLIENTTYNTVYHKYINVTFDLNGGTYDGKSTVQKYVKDSIKEDYTTTEAEECYSIDRPDDPKEYEKQQRKEFNKYITKKFSGYVNDSKLELGDDYKVEHEIVTKDEYNSDEVIKILKELPYAIAEIDVDKIENVEILFEFSNDTKKLKYRKNLILAEINDKWYILNADNQ